MARKASKSLSEAVSAEIKSKFDLNKFKSSKGLNKNVKLNVANAALRTVDFKGGLDKFLMSAKNSKLSSKVKKIKASISTKS